MNDTNDDFSFLTQQIPADVTHTPSSAKLMSEILEALASERPITVTFPGHMLVDSDDTPWGMTGSTVIHPGEAEPVPGDWIVDVGGDGDIATIVQRD